MDAHPSPPPPLFLGLDSDTDRPDRSARSARSTRPQHVPPVATPAPVPGGGGSSSDSGDSDLTQPEEPGSPPLPGTRLNPRPPRRTTFKPPSGSASERDDHASVCYFDPSLAAPPSYSPDPTQPLPPQRPGADASSGSDDSLSSLDDEIVRPAPSVPPTRTLIAAAPAAQRIPDLITSYACPICLEAPRNAVATPCGHLLCGECLFKSVRGEAEREQVEALELSRVEVARAVVWNHAPPTNDPVGPIDVEQGSELFFLTAQQLAGALRPALYASSEIAFWSLLVRWRDPSHHTDSHDFIQRILNVATRIRRRTQQRRRATSTAQPEVQLLSNNASLRKFIYTADPWALSALLAGNRDPEGADERTLIDIRDEISIQRDPALSSGRGHIDDPHTVFWFALEQDHSAATRHAGKSLVVVHGLITALEAFDRAAPVRHPVLQGRLPVISKARSPTVISAVAELTEVNALTTSLSQPEMPLEVAYDSLDRLSAALWAALDENTRRGWTYAEFFGAGQRQRAEASGNSFPSRAPQPLRRTMPPDPLKGACPVCRAAIPGGFFAGIRDRGVQGVKFKLSKPADELRLRYGQQFYAQVQQGLVDPSLTRRLVGDARIRQKPLLPSQSRGAYIRSAPGKRSKGLIISPHTGAGARRRAARPRGSVVDLILSSPEGVQALRRPSPSRSATRSSIRTAPATEPVHDGASAINPIDLSD